MAQKQFHPRPAHSPILGNERIEVPTPLPQPEATKPPILQRILPFVMIIAMVGMMVLMVSMSGTFSPYMLMMPIMMLGGMMMFLGGSGAASTDINADRRNYFLAMREARTTAHRNGKAMFTAQEQAFPQPALLAPLIGVDEPNAPSMWTVRAANPGGFVTQQGTEHEKSFRPYLAARLGRGIVETTPQLASPELPVAEQLEPVSLSGFRKFMRVQGFVAEFPIGYYLGRAPIHVLDGPPERTLPLTRAMIASLTFNHSPDELEMALVTEDPDGFDWSAFKWLPHANDPARMTVDGPARRIYRSLTDFAADLPESVTQRPEFAASASVDGTDTVRDYRHLVVVIDLPNAQVRLPEMFGVGGIDGVTLLVVRAGANELPVAEEGALRLDDRGQLSTLAEPALVRADAMSVAEFDAFARAMGRYRGSQDASTATTVAVSPRSVGRTPYPEALGIDDLDSLDVQQLWERTAGQVERTIPLADILDDTTMRPTGQVMHLNFSEPSIGGTGPHGMVAGTTGSGKSYLLRQLLLSLLARYSPDQVVAVLMDFKGGSAFQGFEKLPHVLGSISDLEKDAELLARAEAVIDGEIVKRKEFLDKYQVGEILDYHKLRATDPDAYPPLPDLFIVVDEFTELITAHPEFKKLYESVGRIGRAYGVHLLLAAQVIEPHHIGAIENQITYGLSLSAAKAADSKTVIKSDAATKLAMGQGHAYLWRKVGDPELTLVQGFAVDAPHIPTVVETDDADVSESTLDDIPTADRILVAFPAISPTDNNENDDEVEVEEVTEPAAPAPNQLRVRDVLLEKLARAQQTQPRQLWQPPLTAPISLGGAPLPTPNGTGLRIRIGDLDDPRNHRRIPYTLRPEGAGAHIRIIGDRRTGKSVTIETIIASAAHTYRPDQVQFYLIDLGSKLKEVEHFPNVGARASATNTELIDRILAEFTRVVRIRRDEFETRDVSSFAAYTASKTTTAVPGDPYGDMFLVIDGITGFINTRQENIDGQIAAQRLATLTELARAGGSLGIHLIVAGEYDATNPRFYDQFGLRILHSSDPNLAVSLLPRGPAQDAYKTIPATQPGRVLEPTTGLHGLIFVPQHDAIDPIAGTDPAEYDPTADYSTGIRALGTHLAGLHTHHAPQITRIQEVLPLESVWDAYRLTREQGAPRALPLGAAVDDLSLITFPIDDPGSSPHLTIVGDARSGRSMVVRTLLRGLAAQYRPDEAQVYLLDPSYSMLDAKGFLESCGLLAGYLNQPGRIEEECMKIAASITAREPDPELVTPEQIRSGSWYQGPKIFVIIDPVTALIPSAYNPSPLDPLSGAIARQRDFGWSLGLHVIVTDQTQQYMEKRHSKLHKDLDATNSDVLLLSGVSGDQVHGRMTEGNLIKFARRRPGMGQLWSRNANIRPVVQTAWTPEFPEVPRTS